jgi:hypothetical protein
MLIEVSCQGFVKTEMVAIFGVSTVLVQLSAAYHMRAVEERFCRFVEMAVSIIEE